MENTLSINGLNGLVRLSNKETGGSGDSGESDVELYSIQEAHQPFMQVVYTCMQFYQRGNEVVNCLRI